MQRGAVRSGQFGRYGAAGASRLFLNMHPVALGVYGAPSAFNAFRNKAEQAGVNRVHSMLDEFTNMPLWQRMGIALSPEHAINLGLHRASDHHLNIMRRQGALTEEAFNYLMATRNQTS